MERTRRSTQPRDIRELPDRSGRLDVASRREALERLRSMARPSKTAGPILITGEAGAGKTRLWNRLADELPAGWRFAVVQAAPSLDPVDFLSLTAAQLGLAPSERVATNRLAIAGALQDESADGRSWVLVVEDAHQASPEVWNEIEALSVSASAPQGVEDGFAVVLLVGRTELARRLAGRSFRAVANHLAGHVHLPPLDVEEAAQLLASAHADRPAAEIERWHRDAAGNPRALLRLAGSRAAGRPDVPARPAQDRHAAPAAVEPPAARPLSFSEPAPARETASRPVMGAEAVAEPIEEPRLEAPPLVPSRPPLRVEEGLIEVGWSGSLDAEDDPITRAEPLAEPRSVATAPLAEETIEDRYAALQAWSEWARNQDRLNLSSDPSHEADGDDDRDNTMSDEEGPPEVEEEAEAGLGSGVRAEGEHEHAPYSQLFTRLKQSQ